MDVTKQMEDAVYSALIEGEIKSGKVKSDVSEIFKEIMAGVVEEAMPFRPIISFMDCGGWRADWFVVEPALSVRLIVSASPGQYPVIFWEVGKEHGVEIATSTLLDSYVKWLAKFMPTISDRPV